MISTFIESGAVPTEKALINQHWVNGGIVVKDRSLTSYGETAGRSGLAIPGFVDLQVNGHGGMDLLSAKTVSDIKQVSKSLYSQGVVGYLPTLITGPKSETLRVMALIENAKREAESDEAKILGIHLEGPFISTAKPGVHPLEHFQIPNLDLIGEYLRAGTVSIVTIAPELPGAIGVIKHLTAMGIVVSLGHSNATAEEAHAGFDAGAKTVTHLWNAMPPMTLRSPGLVGVALERDDVTIQIIVDGVHVCLLYTADAADD
jgi:N-acetylglucosamine-6-phosphate deacetylase